MTLDDLDAALAARGANHIAVATRKEYLNRAYRELVEARPWPFLENEISGASPLPGDFGFIRYVFADERRLLPTTATELAEHDSDFKTRTGSATHYWIEYQNGAPGADRVTYIRTYLVTTDSITVGYLMEPATLIGVNTPLVPQGYQLLIVDRAMVDCYRDDDEPQRAGAMLEAYDRGVQKMAETLMHPTIYDAPDSIRRVNEHEGY